MADLETLSGRKLGEFVLRKRPDEGGYGAVYLCYQQSLDRDVVVKVLHRRLTEIDPVALERFNREAAIAARFDHPGAAHVYAAGADDKDGLLWIAMEFVRGKTLARWLASKGPMTLEQFVPFFDRVAEVVQAAHAAGIVHRDLKPENIMVVEHGGRLLPKLLDFGVAKLTGELQPIEPEAWPEGSLAGRSGGAAATSVIRRQRRAPNSHAPLTPDDFTLGSPLYMAPEQWTNPTAVGPPADIYALGAIAFQSLTGRPPYDAETPSALELLHCEAAIPSFGPSIAIGVARAIRRALAKRAADRWSSALDFAAALRAELDAQILARLRAAARQWIDRDRPASLLWRDEILVEAEEWVRRSGAAVLLPGEIEFLDTARATADAAVEAAERRQLWLRRGLVALAAATVMGGGVVLHFRAEFAEHERDQVAIASEVEQGRQALLHGELADARQHLGAAHRLGDHSPATEFMLARAIEPARAELARLPAASGRSWSAVFSPYERQIATTDDIGVQIWDAATHRRITQLPHGTSVYGAAWSADGARLTTVTAAAIRAWDARSGAALHDLSQPRLDGKSNDYYRMAVSGEIVAAIDADGAEVHVWIAGAAAARLAMGGADEFPAIAISADGRWLAATGGVDVRVWSTATWAIAAKISGPGVRAIAWDPTGPRLIVGTRSGDLAVYDAPGGARLRHLREVGDPVGAVAWSADGQWIAAGAQDGSEQTWDAHTWELRGRANYLHGRVQSIAFAGGMIAAASADGQIAVADVALGLPQSIVGAAGVVRSMRASVDGRRVLIATEAGSVQLWDVSAPYRRSNSEAMTESRCGIFGAAAPDDADLIAVPCLGRPTRIWRRGDLVAELPAVTAPGGDFQPPFPVAFGDRAAIARGAVVELYALPSGALQRQIQRDAAVTAIALGAGGVLSGDASGGVWLDDRKLAAAHGGVDAILWLPGNRIVVADAARHLMVLSAGGELLADMASPARARMLRARANRLIAVPYYLDSTPPTLWDIEGYRLVADLGAHLGPVFGARFTSAGIVTAGGDGAARLWNPETGRLVQLYRGTAKYLADATVDGDLVVGGTATGDLRFWDRSSGRPLWVLQAHTSTVVGIAVDGTDLITHGFRGDVARWTVPLPAAAIGACGGSEDANDSSRPCGTVAP